MFNKIAVISFFVLFSGLTIWLFVKSFTPEKLTVGSSMPTIVYQDTAGVKTVDNQYKGKTVLVLISLNCPFCKKLITELNNDITQLHGYRIYILAKEANIFEAIKGKWIKNISDLLKSDNVSFGIIKNKVSEEALGTTSVPSTFVFDRNNRLLKKIKGVYSSGELQK